VLAGRAGVGRDGGEDVSERLRWKLWGLVTRSRRVCPANAVGAVVWRTQPLRGILVDGTCRRDCARNGACWCGNLRAASRG
jgi:hypothetical protein